MKKRITSKIVCHLILQPHYPNLHQPELNSQKIRLSKWTSLPTIHLSAQPLSHGMASIHIFTSGFQQFGCVCLVYELMNSNRWLLEALNCGFYNNETGTLKCEALKVERDSTTLPLDLIAITLLMLYMSHVEM